MVQQMERKFELFVKNGSKRKNRTISLNKANGWSFNTGFYLDNEIKKYKYVILGYENNRNEVCFLFTNDELPGKWKITHRENSASLSTHSFFNTYNIDANKFAGRYEPQVYLEPGTGRKMYFISLTEKEQNA